MTTLMRVRTTWTGLPGLPGYSNMYFSTTDPLGAGANLAGSAVRAFWFTIRDLIPAGGHLLVESSVALIEDVTGIQDDELAITPAPTDVGAAGTGNYGAAGGGVVTWNTAGFRYGRRIRGRTFIVPMVASAYDATGSLSSTALSALQGAATALLASGAHMQVFSRPSPAVSAADDPKGIGRAARPGGSSGVTTATVHDFNAVLRSRRD